MIIKRNVMCEIMLIVGNEFGLWLQRKREELGWSQKKLADLAGLNRSVINKIENGYSEPELKTLVAISEAIKVPIEILVRLVLSKPATPPDTEYAEEFLHLIRQLSPDDQQEILELLKFKVERKEKTRKSGRSREKPPAQMLLKGE